MASITVDNADKTEIEQEINGFAYSRERLDVLLMAMLDEADEGTWQAQTIREARIAIGLVDEWQERCWDREAEITKQRRRVRQLSKQLREIKAKPKEAQQ